VWGNFFIVGIWLIAGARFKLCGKKNVKAMKYNEICPYLLLGWFGIECSGKYQLSD